MSGYYVRLPKLTDLTHQQRIAVNDIKPIFISGLAGSGKSVCLIYRYINRLKSSNGDSPPPPICLYHLYKNIKRIHKERC
ncbi:hypothetical protein ACWIUD_10230 [Helicobacter sp. 23-1044]